MADRGGRGEILVAVIGALGVSVLVAVASFADPAASQPRSDNAAQRVTVVVDGASPDLFDFVDPATGCTYLVHRLGGVTPRLDAVGRPLCRGGRP